MVMSCSAYKCPEKYEKNSPVTFHSFPKDPERRNKWIAALRIDGFIPKPHSKICSNHFTHDSFDWEKFGGKWLKPDAVPTVFIHLPRSSEQVFASTAASPLSIFVRELDDSNESNMVSDSMSSSDEESGYQDLKENTPPPERLAFIEDFEKDVIFSPSKAQKRWSIAKDIIQKQKKTIQRLQLRNHRLHKKIALLTEMIVVLKKKDISDSTEDTLESNGGTSSETVYSPTIIKISIP